MKKVFFILLAVGAIGFVCYQIFNPSDQVRFYEKNWFGWTVAVSLATLMTIVVGAWSVKSGKMYFLLYALAVFTFLLAAYFVPSSPVNISMILAILGCFSCSMARNYKDAQKFTSDAAKLGRYWKARLSLPILKIYAFLAIIWLALIIGTYLKQKGAPL